MGLVDYIIGGFRRVRSSLTTNIWNVGSPPVYGDMDNHKAISDGFNSNTAVYSIVIRDAEKFAAIPRYVYDAKEMEEKAYEPVENNALTELLNRPNEYQGQDLFLLIARVYKKVLDECFIWLNRGDVTMKYDPATEVFSERDEKEYAAMPILEMYVLPADHVLVVPDPDNLWGIKSYILDVGGNYMPIRKEDVIHWKGVNLEFDAFTRTHLRGRSPLISGNDSLQVNKDASRGMVRTIQNDGSKGVLTNETLDKMTPEQRTQLGKVIDAKINNADLKGAVATLQGKWNYFQLNSGIDLKLIETKEMSWKELCFLLNVPYEFFNSDTTFANKELAQKAWVSNTIVPACKQLDGELNRVLLKAFGLEGKFFIACDYSELPEMQQDLLQLAQAMEKSPVTPNEWREAMGYETRPEPEMDEVWMPTGKQPLSQYNDAAEMEMVTQELMNRQIGKPTNGVGNKKESV